MTREPHIVRMQWSRQSAVRQISRALTAPMAKACHNCHNGLFM